MLRLYHVLLGGALLLLIPLGIKIFDPRLSATTELPKQSQTSSPAPNQGQGNIWQNVLGKTTVPNGWQVNPCDGTAPMLCVSANGESIGTVEMGVYPLEKQQNFQKMLLQAGIEPSTNIDSQNPKYQAQVYTALNAWINDHYIVLSKDRQNSYSDRITFSTHPPQKVQVGNLQGLSYGFTGLKRQGGIQERHLGYVAFDGKAIYVITTAFDPGSQTGKFEKQEHLAIFEPYLTGIVSNLELPK